MLEIADGPEGCTGKFLVSQVIDDEHLKLRRIAASAATGLNFRVRRFSGCNAVPGDCAIEVKAGSDWRTTVPAKKGDYRLGFFYRAFDPPHMGAKALPTARIVIRAGKNPGRPLARAQQLEVSYLWQRADCPVKLAADGDLTIKVSAGGPEAMQYTGFSLTREK
jgi:hypothetical protein